MYNKEVMKYQNKLLGILCMLLPVVAPLWALIKDGRKGCWYSVSVTFYTCAMPAMVGLLITCSIVFASYLGYRENDNGKKDNGDWITALWSAISALLIVIFPCYWDLAPELVGWFQLPSKYTSIVHNVAAASLFASFFYMIRFRFTKHKGRMTIKKERRNGVYKVCATIIVAAMLSQVVTSVLGIGFMTIINEFFMLEAFGVAWETKGGLIKALND